MAHSIESRSIRRNVFPGRGIGRARTLSLAERSGTVIVGDIADCDALIDAAEMPGTVRVIEAGVRYLSALDRLGDSEDIASLVAFLASYHTGFVSGEIL